jgi:AcrR family transcriptional regulator
MRTNARRLESSLRVDAEANRQRILEAARVVFAERGIDAPLDEIARRAGVGNATLYRRFPTRGSLIAATFDSLADDWADVATSALAEPDPWLAFRNIVLAILELQAADRGAGEVLTRMAFSDRRLDARRIENFEVFEGIALRAQAAGKLRRDFVPEDFALLLMANAGVVRVMSTTAPTAWRRFAAIFLDGCRREAAGELPTPPSAARVVGALRRQAKGPANKG